MHLQSLEIIGFKSFAAKTVLEFHRGVTAVVGPNGCGKSNILDAIRWVLGEQSAKALRGGEMADVIFSGTDSRHAHNMAEVSLTFGDCEQELGVAWNELRITRRVFRDGKAEYLINGKACRLKDIHEIFMDTGIGRSAYSIMEQGKLDQILSSRPEDRRAIFEEAAGITKFKSQKKEALRKLEYTEGNLLRVTDIIKEVKRQIGSLQRQAGKARRYQKILSELRVLDTHVSHHNYGELHEKMRTLSSSIEKNSTLRHEQDEIIVTQEQEGVRLKEALVDLDRLLEETRGTSQTLRNRIFSSESRIATNGERQSELRAIIGRAEQECALFVTRVSEQEKQQEETESELAKLLEHLAHEQQALQEGTHHSHQAIKERQEAERAADTLAHQLHALENRSADLRGKISVARGRQDAAVQRLEQLTEEHAQMDEALAILQTRAHEAREAHRETQEALVEVKAALEGAQRNYEKKQAERQSAERDCNELSKKLAERTSRYDLLSQLEREGEGLGEGTQALLRGLHRPDFFLAGIVGTLASLLNVPTQEMLAVEAALGAVSRSVVFKDTQLACEALQTLKSSVQGKATLLISGFSQAPLERDASGTLPNRALLPQDAIAWASEAITAPDSVSPLVRRLLENVAIVENLETAFRLKAHHPALAFATREGEFISRDGVVYGGKDAAVSSVALLRHSQITHLQDEIATLQGEEEHLIAIREATTEALEQALLSLKEVREALNQKQMMLAKAQGDERIACHEYEEKGRRFESLGREISTLQGQTGQLEGQRELHEKELVDMVEALTSLREKRARAQEQITSLREVENKATARLAETGLRVARDQERERSLSQQRGPIAARLREFQEGIRARERDIHEHETKIEKLAQESEELAASIITWKSELACVESDMTQALQKRTRLQEELESIDQKLRLLRQGLLALQESRSKEEVELTEVRMRSEAVHDHIVRRYQIDLTAFNPDRSQLLEVVTAHQEKKESESCSKTEACDTTLANSDTPVSQDKAQGDQETPVLESSIDQVSWNAPWERIKQLVAELMQRVDAMGPVNIDAIAEYEELEERYKFLEQQNHDLIEGKKELLEAITRINKTTRELFATTFEQVRLNFQEMFTELFGGGKANLLLVDDADPLESGIEMIAKPPGKQLQSISLLSGGERTMTAVALLFAIYMVKPSPFCVLDEMDAPLDESNIGRFIKLLDRFVGQSQFFVITHNKATMSRADMIYGVTMEEQGVTKLLSVKFHQQVEDTQ